MISLSTVTSPTPPLLPPHRLPPLPLLALPIFFSLQPSTANGLPASLSASSFPLSVVITPFLSLACTFSLSLSLSLTLSQSQTAMPRSIASSGFPHRQWLPCLPLRLLHLASTPSLSRAPSARSPLDLVASVITGPLLGSDGFANIADITTTMSVGADLLWFLPLLSPLATLDLTNYHDHAGSRHRLHTTPS